MGFERHENPLAVHWVTDYGQAGNAYGYSMQNACSRRALQHAGARISPDAAAAFHVAPAHLFRPIEGKRNILFMAWETEELPADYLAGMARADAVIVTASFLLPIVRRAFPEKPSYLCPLGVDTEIYSFRRRVKSAGRPFRYLWVGAPNARKGWELVMEAWRAFEQNGRVELYIKTTVTNRVERHRNVIFDSRNMPGPELAALYHSAHAFLFPSFGEGFGLTMAEAMSTGLPVLYTPWSSLNDMANESCAYPLAFDLVPAWAMPEGGLSTRTEAPHAAAVRTRLAQARTDDLACRMIEVHSHYAKAARKGAAAAARIRNQFTWDRTGRRLAEILKEVIEPCPPTCALATT